jgi:hypothetical protein
MDCEKELRGYKELLGVAACLENELIMLKEMRADPGFEDEGIAAASLGGAEHAALGQKRGDSRVERCAVDKAAGERDELDKEIERMEKRLKRIRYTIRRVEAMLGALTQRERLVVQKFYIEGYPWSDVVALYKKEMPSPREADALKATRNNAMAKMNRIFDRCRRGA